MSENPIEKKNKQNKTLDNGFEFVLAVSIIFRHIHINTIPFYISHHNRAAHLHLQAAAAPVQVHAGA